MNDVIKQYVAVNLGIDDDETIQMLIDSYREALEENMAKLAVCVADADMAATRQAAHALKGCSANIGLEALRAICYELECAGAQNQPDRAKELLVQLQVAAMDFRNEQ